MNQTLVQYLSYLVGISAITGLLRFKKIDPVFYPFIIMLWAGFINELTSTFMIKYFRTSAVNSNIYVLIQSLLIAWFFWKLNLFRKNKLIFGLLFIGFPFFWTIEIYFISGIRGFASYFRIIYSFVTVLMSIHMINYIIVNEKKSVFKNSTFLIMIGFVAFFTYKALLEIFWVYGLSASKEFSIQVYRILTYINLIVNLLYIMAVIWMPRKREYTLL